MHGYLDSVLREIHDDNVDIDGTDKYGHTALMLAACNQHPHIVRALIHAGININYANTRGFTPLIAAIWDDTSDSIVSVLWLPQCFSTNKSNYHS